MEKLNGSRPSNVIQRSYRPYRKGWLGKVIQRPDVLSTPIVKKSRGMAVKRVVANIATDQMDAAKAFYGDVLGMSLGMDHGCPTAASDMTSHTSRALDKNSTSGAGACSPSKSSSISCPSAAAFAPRGNIAAS